MLDQDKMCHSIEILMEYISITLLSGRYDFVVEGYEETYRIKLINDNLSITELEHTPQHACKSNFGFPFKFLISSSIKSL